DNRARVSSSFSHDEIVKFEIDCRRFVGSCRSGLRQRRQGCRRPALDEPMLNCSRRLMDSSRTNAFEMSGPTSNIEPELYRPLPEQNLLGMLNPIEVLRG